MAAILKEILDRVEMPQQTADARLLSILCDEADKSMILQLEADELIPYSVLAETGNAIKKYLGVPSVKIYRNMRLSCSARHIFMTLFRY